MMKPCDTCGKQSKQFKKMVYDENIFYHESNATNLMA